VISSFSRRLATRDAVGLIVLDLPLWTLAAAVATSSLTFNWVVEHRPEANLFPEFAGRVVYLSDILLVFGLALWTIGRLLRQHRKLEYGPWYVAVPIAVLLALTLLSIVWAIDGSQAGYSGLRRLLLVGLSLVMANEAARARLPVIATLLCLGGLQAAVSLGQVATGSALGLASLGELAEGALGHGWIGCPRALGLGFNPNPVGLFLATVSLVSYGVFLSGNSRRWVRALGLMAFLATFAGLLVTDSRSALLGWCVGLLLMSGLTFASRRPEARSVLRSVGVAVLLAGVAALSIHLASTSELLTCRAASNAGLGRLAPAAIARGLETRTNDYDRALPILFDNLPLGVGAGNYPTALKAARSPDRFGGAFTPVHNVALLMAAELGLLGAAAWGLLLLAPAIWVLRSRGERVDPQALIWFGPFEAILIVSFFDFPPWATQDGRVLFAAILGLWVGAGQRRRDHLQSQPKTPAVPGARR
jgi:O-antigen ligase